MLLRLLLFILVHLAMICAKAVAVGRMPHMLLPKHIVAQLARPAHRGLQAGLIGPNRLPHPRCAYCIKINIM